MQAWLGLGSNLQQPARQLETALAKVAETDGIEILQRSSFYRTAPWGDEDQGDFINAVIRIETDLQPETLLTVLQSIENNMGRKRTTRQWGPRLIDIDILLYGNLELRTSRLELPHPHMHKRVFVLRPLFELDSELEVPGHGKVSMLLRQLGGEGIRRLDDAGAEVVDEHFN